MEDIVFAFSINNRLYVMHLFFPLTTWFFSMTLWLSRRRVAFLMTQVQPCHYLLLGKSFIEAYFSFIIFSFPEDWVNSLVLQITSNLAVFTWSYLWKCRHSSKLTITRQMVTETLKIIINIKKLIFITYILHASHYA